jgi:protein involved in polysaccharide export with SLBB domain
MYIIRKQENGETSKIRFDYKAALKNADKRSNLQLEPGDVIVVP